MVINNIQLLHVHAGMVGYIILAVLFCGLYSNMCVQLCIDIHTGGGVFLNMYAHVCTCCKCTCFVHTCAYMYML